MAWSKIARDAAARARARHGITAPARPVPAVLVSKISTTKAAVGAGEWHKALAIAAKFPDLGEHKEAITRAHAAITNPQFYIDIGRDPDALIKAGIDAMKVRYQL